MEKTKSLMSGNTKSNSVSEEQKTTPVNRFSVDVATSVHTSEFQSITTQHTTTLFQPITTQKTMPLPPHLFVPRRPIVPIAVTLFDIGRELYSSCTQHSQCPEHAQCRPNGCQGYLCLCDEGYIASEDRKFCLRAIRNGERCDPRTDKCLSKFSMCVGVCKCLEFFEHTRDGRCKLPNAGYLGDDCTKRGCQYPSKCVEGNCRCVHPFRKLTAEEFWVSPQSTLQCRMHEYSLDKCNGSYIQVPRDLRPNTTTQPQFTTDATLEILSYSPYIVDISTQSIDFLKDSKMALSSATSQISTALAANYSTSKQLHHLFSSYSIASALSSFSLPNLNPHIAESRMSIIQGSNNLNLERVSITAKKSVLDNFSMEQSYTSIALFPLFDLMRSVLLNPNNQVTDHIDVKTEMPAKQGNTRLSTSILNTGVASSVQFNNIIDTRSEYYSVGDSLVISSNVPVVSPQGLSAQNDQESNIYSEKSDIIDSKPNKFEGYDEKNSSIKYIMNSVFLSINNREHFSQTYNARPTTGIYGLQSSFSSDFEVSVAKTKHRKTFGESSTANAKYNHDVWESVVVYSSSLSRPISTTGIVSNAYSSLPISFDISDHLPTLPTMNMNFTQKLNDVKVTSHLRDIFTTFSMKPSSYDQYLNMTSISQTMNRSNEVSFKYYNYMTGTSVYNMHVSDVLDSKQKSGVSFSNEDRTNIPMLGTNIELSHVSSANVKNTDVSELTSDENKTIYPISVYLNSVKQSISLKRKEIVSTKSVLYKDESLNYNIGEFSNQDTKIDTELHIESITTQTAYELNNTLSTYKLSREDINFKPLSTILKTVETHKGLNSDNVDLIFNSLRVVDSDELNISPSKTSVNLYQTFSQVSEESSPVVTMVPKTNSFQIDHITPLVVYDTDNKYSPINSTSSHPFLSFDGVNLTHNVLNSMSFQQKSYQSILYLTSSKLSNRDDNVNAIVSSIFTNEQGNSLGTQTPIDTLSHISKSTLITDLTHQINDSTLAHKLSYDEVYPTELRHLFLHSSSDKSKQIDETDIIIQLHRTPNKDFDGKLINHTFKHIIQLSNSNTDNLINDSKLNVPSSHMMYTEFIEESDRNNFSPKSNVAIESYADRIYEPSLSTKMTNISLNTLPEVDPTVSDKKMLTEAIIKSAFTNTDMVTEANNIETKLLENSLETIVQNITSATAFGSRVNDSTEGFAFQNTITTALLPTFRSIIRETTFNFAVTDSDSKVTSQFEFQNTVAETLVSVLKHTPKQLKVSAFDAMVMKAVPTFNFDNTVTAENTVSIYENKILQSTLPFTFGNTLLETSPIINKEDKHTGIKFTHEFRVITTEALPISMLENKMIDASTSSSFEPRDAKAVLISTIYNTVLEASENLNAHEIWMNNILSSSFLDTFLKAKGTSVPTTLLTELATSFHTQLHNNFLTREQDKATFQLNSVFNLSTDIKHRLTTSIMNELPSLISSSEQFFSNDLDIDRYSYTSPYLLYPSLKDDEIFSNYASKEVLTNPSESGNLKTTFYSMLKEPIVKYSDVELFVNLVPTTSQAMDRQEEDKMTRFKSRMTTNIPNVTPKLPEADFPGEKPKPPEVIRSGIDQLILPISIVGVFLVNVIAAIIVLICRRKRRSDRARNLDEAKKRKLAEEQKQKHRFKIPRPNVHPPEYSNIIDNSSSDSSTYYNFLNTGFSTFHEENDTYEEIDKKVLKGSL
ncbi:unnamed protein product [Mytilus coruscus]|uniref:EGF-like domain-containing protein n=1 Tax=Mytilus coruscus TaxID=42192 RepID=A0A6J8ATD3_MYTCO|nr:unnamed protein product [Mytilus coruscus]